MTFFGDLAGSLGARTLGNRGAVLNARQAVEQRWTDEFTVEHLRAQLEGATRVETSGGTLGA